MKISNIKFHENSLSCSRAETREQPVRPTDLKKLTDDFREYANAPKNGTASERHKTLHEKRANE
jgi:hypothetical protein